MTPLSALFSQNGINLTDTRPGRYYTTCPRCSAARSKEHRAAAVLGVTIDGKGARWGCSHCSWTGPGKGNGAAGGKTGITPTYVYRDAAGVPRFGKVRKQLQDGTKGFWLAQPDGHGGWKKGTKGVDTSTIYRADEAAKAVQAGRVICVVEGEKDADNLWRIGLPATCNAHGASEPGRKPKWTEAHSKQLAGADIVVFNDNDLAGYVHCDATCRLSHGIAKRVRRLDLREHWPAIPKGGDISDWLAVGGEHTPERLLELIESSRDYVAAKAEPEQTISNDSDADDGADPLAGLVTKAEADPGAPFVPEVLKALAELKKADRAAFESMRVKLKGVGCKVTALDDAIAEESGDTGRGPSQADILLDLAQAAQLFHSPDGAGFADLDIGGHRETWPIRAKGFRRWLARRFYEEVGGAPSSEAMQSALGVIEAKAHFDAPEHVVHIRAGGLDGKIYLDLCDDAWRAIEIDALGWRPIEDPPVRFRRAAGMKPLPMPVAGGKIEALRPFLNVKTDNDFVLVVAWLLAALRERGPYPVFALAGEQGSSKSTFSSVLRALVDPSTSPLRALPREDRDLFIAASNAHVLAFDNVSGLPAWISDTLCRLSTGGGFAVRQLYSDSDEMLFDASRPVVLNGIEDIITRPDLADRAIFLTLDPIPEENRKPETELWAAFEAARPQILGALLDSTTEGLRRLPETRLEKLPRMADFALWATACEGAMWEPGTFGAAYGGNRDDAVESVIEADPVATTVRTLMAAQTTWTGKAASLLSALIEIAGEKAAKARDWPSSPRALSGRLRRAAPFLRKAGIAIDFDREKKAARTRTITITFSEPEKGGNFASTPSTPSNPSDSNGLEWTDEWTVGGGDTPTVHPTVHSNPLENEALDGLDGMDAKFPSLSGQEKGDSPAPAPTPAHGTPRFAKGRPEEAASTPSAPSTGRPWLSDKAVQRLAVEYFEKCVKEQATAGSVNSSALDERLRQELGNGGVPAEALESELGRVMEIVYRMI